MQGRRGRGEAENGQFQERIYFLFRPLLKALKSVAKHMKKTMKYFFLDWKINNFLEQKTTVTIVIVNQNIFYRDFKWYSSWQLHI